MIGFIYRIPMANMLGKEGNGIYSVTFGVYNVVLTLSSYSLPLVVSKLVSERLARREYQNSYRLFKGAIVFALLAGAIAAIFLFFGANTIEQIYGTPGLEKPLKVMAPTVLLVAFLGVLRGYYQGCETMIPTALSQIIEQVINAVVSVLGVWIFMRTYQYSADRSAYGAAGGTMGTLAGAFCALLFLTYVYVIYHHCIKTQNMHDRTKERESTAHIIKALLYTMVPIIFSQTIYQIAYTLDDLIFSNMMSLKGFADDTIISLQGVFNSQYTLLINVPVAVATAMAATIIPSIVVSQVQEREKEMHQKINTVIKFVMVIAAPSAVGLAVLATPIIHLLFPNLTEYNNTAVRLLEYGTIAIIFYSISTITTAILQGLNEMKLPVYHVGVSLVIHIVLIMILLKWTELRIYALLIGDITFPLIVCILNYISIIRKTGFHLGLKGIFLLPCLSAGIMGVGTFLVYKFVIGVIALQLPSLVCAFLAAVGIYIYAIMKLKCFTKDELTMIGLHR